MTSRNLTFCRFYQVQVYDRLLRMWCARKYQGFWGTQALGAQCVWRVSVSQKMLPLNLENFMDLHPILAIFDILIICVFEVT